MLATRINDTISIVGKVNGVEISQTYIGITIMEAIKLFISETQVFAQTKKVC